MRHIFKKEDWAEMFHQSVAQLLFLSSISRRDIHVVVSFLTTIVKIRNDDDKGDLKRVLKYLKENKHMKLTLIL